MLVPWLAAQFQAVHGVTVRVCTDTPADLADVVPVVQVYAVTGTDAYGFLSKPVVEAASFGATREEADLTARRAHRLLHRWLPGTVTGGGVVTQVTTVKHPGWLPYDDPNVRRFGATYEITLHPAPAS